MTPSRSLFSLSRLRRSVRLAVLALAVFVLRVGLVSACAPSDLAETFAHEAGSVVAAHVDDAVAPDSANESGGHCLHCSCHHATAVPVVVLPLAPVMSEVMVGGVVAAQTHAPPDVSLRPPIA